MKFQAVLFDLDGTLLDTLDDLTDSCNYALIQMGCVRRTPDEVRGFVGDGARKLIERAMPSGSTSEDITRCLAIFQAHYKGNMENKTAPYPGALELLSALKARSVKLGVVSNKFDGAVQPLCEKHFGDLLGVALGEREGIAKKPAPDAIYCALAALGVAPENALYVGDSDVDVVTARNAGVSCIAVSWGFRPRENLTRAGARHVIDRMEEFLDKMAQMEKE